jgi:hypothetical protein
MKRVSLLLVLAVVLLIAGPAPAQELYCSSLNRADCALYYRTGMPLPDSASFKMNTLIQISDRVDFFDFTINARGSYVTDPDVIAQLAGMSSALDMLDDPTDIDMETLQELTVAALSAFDADLRLEFDLPREVSGGFIQTPIVVDLWYVDSVGYIDLTPLGRSFYDPTLDGTYGFDLDSASDFFFGLFDDESLADFLAEIDAEASTSPDAANTSLKEQLAVNDATTIQRLPDENGLAVFEYRVDVLPLLALPSVREAMYASDTEGEFSQEEIDAIADAMIASITSPGFIVRETVDPESRHTIRIELVWDVTIDTSEFTRVYSQATGDYSLGQGIGNMDVLLALTLERFDINSGGPITAPEADLVSLFEMMLMFE